jgi:hypothetical protein
MTTFLVADHIDWFARLIETAGSVIVFPVVYLLVNFSRWNYFASFAKRSGQAKTLLL